MKPTLLIISQVYVPDPASVGQYLADAAVEMSRRGYRTLVYTSARGYDDPSEVYPSRETRGGVEIRRLPLSSFGKSSIVVRLIAQCVFLLQAITLGLFTRNLCGIMISTSPPFCGLAGIVIGKLRRVPVKYWVMDLNPDQLVAMNILPKNSFAVRVFDAINRQILRLASDVVVLDRFMAERVNRKINVAAKLEIMPPWPHEDQLEPIEHSENPFRQSHVSPRSLVLMYSGNHSPANPLDTLLDAVASLQTDTRLMLLCIGGGSAKREVDDRVRSGVKNIRSMPYEPFDKIRFSLSAADVHIVSIGNDVVGIVHPCKVYGAMAVARPILMFGPAESHISDLIQKYRIGWHVAHGDVGGAINVIRDILNTPSEELREMGDRAANVIATVLSKQHLMREFCDVVQRGLPTPTTTDQNGISIATSGNIADRNR